MASQPPFQPPVAAVAAPLEIPLAPPSPPPSSSGALREARPSAQDIVGVVLAYLDLPALLCLREVSDCWARAVTHYAFDQLSARLQPKAAAQARARAERYAALTGAWREHSTAAAALGLGLLVYSQCLPLQVRLLLRLGRHAWRTHPLCVAGAGLVAVLRPCAAIGGACDAAVLSQTRVVWPAHRAVCGAVAARVLGPGLGLLGDAGVAAYQCRRAAREPRYHVDPVSARDLRPLHVNIVAEERTCAPGAAPAAPSAGRGSSSAGGGASLQTEAGYGAPAAARPPETSNTGWLVVPVAVPWLGLWTTLVRVDAGVPACARGAGEGLWIGRCGSVCRLLFGCGGWEGPLQPCGCAVKVSVQHPPRKVQ